jgi:folate-binding protein YgfZ
MSATAADYAAIRQRGGIADLSDRTKLRFTGADRIRYLNGQVTANVTRLRAGESLPACVTTAKGKLSADVVISLEPRDTIGAGTGGLIIDAPPGQRESLVARLERYIIADDVAVEDVSDAYGLLHFLPPDGAGVESLQGVHGSPWQAIRSQRFGRVGFDLFLPREAVESQITEFFPAHYVVIEEALLETLRVEAGIPRWGAELDENTLPPEAGLDRTHVDYHKGCYIGQEVISRLKSVGHVNRQLTGFVSIDSEPLTPGLQLFAAGETAKPVGQLTSAAWSFALSKPVALGYLRHGSTAAELVARPASGDGPAIRLAVCPLPFVS